MRTGVIGTGITFADHFSMAALAEELGFDAYFLPEHHQEPYWPSAPLITLAAIAARTSRIRLGTAVTVMALHNPVRLAEEVATLDQLSGGRVILGLGLGYQRKDFAALGVPRQHRRALLEEGVQVLRSAWSHRPFTFSGAHFGFENVSVFPEPYQRPHPPIWLGAWTRQGVRRAGRIADGWITDPLHGLEAVRTLAEEYRQAAREAGRDPYIVLMRQFALARDRQAATETFGSAVVNTWRYYWRSKSFSRGLEPEWEQLEGPEEIGLDMVLPGRVPFGGPEECARSLQEWLDVLQPQYLIATPTPCLGDPSATAMELRLLAEEVLPRISTV